MRAIIFTVILLFAAGLCFGQSNKTPLAVRLLDKPKELKAGETHKVTFEVRNVSGAGITLSSRCAETISLSWENDDGSRTVAGSGCFMSINGMSDTGDRYKNKVTGVIEIPPYFESDFFTLPPGGSKKFEVNLKVPEKLEVEVVDVYVRYESKYDGSLYGIRAWTGSASQALKMRVIK